MQNQSLNLKRIVIALSVAGIFGAAGYSAIETRLANAAAPVATAALPAQAAKPGAPAISAAGLPDFSQIAARNGPAVVNISVTGTTKVAMEESDEAPARGAPRAGPFGNDPFFEFFRRFQGPGMPEQGGAPTHGTGSGFIVDANGIILTNAHVVRDAKVVMVKLTDRREFVAKVLGSDPKTDVAVLKIEATNLPTVTLGNTADLKVGEWVLAIGSPFGFENSVTAGVVSAKGRSLPDDSYVPFIQTDVAVNPGNSGGPLFNLRGEVVGINAQIFSHTGGYQGLSFAIPIDVASRVRDQIVATGKVEHAKLGVAVQEVNQAFADAFKLDRPEGALVANVEKGGAADKAGVAAGDVIRKVDGRAIVASGDLPAIIGQARPGDSVKLEVWRQGRALDLTAKLGDASAGKAGAATAAAPAGQGKLGLALRPMEPQEKEASGGTGGIVIDAVQGPAAAAGVQAGDVLLAINGRPVVSVEQVREVVAQSGKAVALLIARGGERIFIPVRVG